MATRRLSPPKMLSKAEAEFLRGSKQAKPQQLRYLRHCVRKKIRALRENDLPAIMANGWARDLFKDAIEANSGYAIESNSAGKTYPSETQDLSGPGRIRTGDLRRVRAQVTGSWCHLLPNGPRTDCRKYRQRRARSKVFWALPLGPRPACRLEGGRPPSASRGP